MSTQVLALALVGSFLSSLIAVGLGFFSSRRSLRLSAGMLGLSGLLGVGVGWVLAFGQDSSLLLPQDLFLNAAGSQLPTWFMFYDMVFALDRFSAFFYGLISLSACLVAMYVVPYFESGFAGVNGRFLQALSAALIFSLQGILLSTNILGFVSFWEGMTMAVFFLVLSQGTAAAQRVAWLFLVMSHLAAGAICAGLFLLSGGALFSDFSVLAMITPQLSQGTVTLALVLFLFGFGKSVGVIPVHVWLPLVYRHLPTPAAVLLSGAVIPVTVYGFLRILLFLLPTTPMWFMGSILAIGSLTAVMAGLAAVLERDLKNMLAMIGVMGVGLLCVMIATGLLAGQEANAEIAQVSLYAMLILVMSQAFGQAGAYFLYGTLADVFKDTHLDRFGGLIHRLPYASVIAGCLLLALASLPPFGSFMAMWMFLQVGINNVLYVSSYLQGVLIFVFVLMTFTWGLSLFAGVKLFASVFLAVPRSEGMSTANLPANVLLLPSMLLAIASLGVGMITPTLVDHLGANNLLASNTVWPSLRLGDEILSPLQLGLVIAGIIGLSVGMRYWLSPVERERVIPVWQGGRTPAVLPMYTATALSAPIRYFFRFVMRSQKHIQATRLADTNPWITQKSVTISDDDVWLKYLYQPIQKGFTYLSHVTSKIQNGSLQMYLMLMLLAFAVTLIIAV